MQYSLLCDNAGGIMQLDAEYKERLKDSILSSIVLQGVLLLFAGFMLDGGILLAIMEIISCAYWVAAAVLLISRLKKLTDTDFFYLKWGIFINMILGYLVMMSASLIFHK